MALALYHYVHCPFCVRVRMALGYLGLNYESRVTAYDDEETPVKLTGKKMLPALVDGSRAMNESLDIIQYLDEQNVFQVENVKNDPHFPEFESLLIKLGEQVHSLVMPYWIYTPEFNESSREYFQHKKEQKRGPFRELVKNRADYQHRLNLILENLSLDLKPYYRSESLSLYDIMLASHLWGMYVVPEFQFAPELHRYLQQVRSLCHFNYHGDFWK